MINILNSLKSCLTLEFCWTAPLLITLTKNSIIKVPEYLFARIYIGQNSMSVFHLFYQCIHNLRHFCSLFTTIFVPILETAEIRCICLFFICLLCQLLRKLVKWRRDVKTWMKTASGLKRQQLDIQQQALKLTANRFNLVFSQPLVECSKLTFFVFLSAFKKCYGV